ncbi:MAG TPA: S4 domain-containing protein, partial [Kofleriaceae bacterium]|nr:S4 domain-containing protein [Kofleriaceae bacterium]
MLPPIEHRVEPGESGLRLDRFLAGRHPGVPRQAMLALLAARQVRVNGRVASKGQRLAAGDRVQMAGVPS